MTDAATKPPEQTPELLRVLNDVNAIAAEFDDGIDWGDLYALVPRVMEIVETVEVLTGEQKKALCLNLFDTLLDKIDLPGPDFVVKPIIKMGLPWIIDELAKATNGGYAINKGTDTPTTS